MEKEQDSTTLAHRTLFVKINQYTDKTHWNLCLPECKFVQIDILPALRYNALVSKSV